MKKQKLPKEFTKKDFLDFFEKVDRDLNKKLSITILGGASIVLLGFKDRATHDIDVAPPVDPFLLKLGKKNNIPIQYVGGLVSTVDFVHCEKPLVFKGKLFTVYSISPEELMKSKLERFQKQDPEDTYNINARSITITNTGSSTAENLSINYPTWPSGTTASSS